ncbi:MAG: Rrf2 family transcriptional regulator [Alphaproteobacteria bacterium]|jgi:Rrf2 family transcriptional regulator, iron-sulfur cluster assembly transcription factor|nr:Rrf2 family transcriptional regulator [Alphaproteobacteria bacterium]
MLRVSKKLVYALEAVVDIAYNGGAAPVRSRDITKRQGVPHRYLEQVMQQLVHEGVLKGVRGPKGGYLLARERRRITVGEIARIVRSLEAAEDPLQGETHSELAAAVLGPLWLELQTEFESRLDTITIEDMCRRATESEIKRAGDLGAEFNI